MVVLGIKEILEVFFYRKGWCILSVAIVVCSSMVLDALWAQATRNDDHDSDRVTLSQVAPQVPNGYSWGSAEERSRLLEAITLVSDDPDALWTIASNLKVQLRSEMGVACFSELASQGNAAAQGILGMLSMPLEHPDTGMVQFWLQEGADGGDLSAKMFLGDYYRDGRGVKTDKNKAERLYGEALAAFRIKAKEGSAIAHFRIGQIHALGRGVPKNEALAAFKYRQAAEMGLAEARCELGRIRELWVSDTPETVYDGKKEAVKQYTIAALEQGAAHAEYRLGCFYKWGVGTWFPMDEQIALGWYERAAARGHKEAKTEGNKLHTEVDKLKKKERKGA